MTTEVRNTWINYFQCWQGTNMSKLNSALGNGICAKAEVKKNNVISAIIDILYRHSPNDDIDPTDITFSYLFEIGFSGDEDNDATIRLILNDTTYIATSDESLSDLVSILETQLQEDGFSTESLGGSLYVWSTDDAYLDATVTTLYNSYSTFSGEVIDAEDLLDIGNCLTSEQICDIIQFGKKLISTGCGC